VQFASWRRIVAGLLASGVVLWSQTQVDLRTQSREVDFSAAQSTKPAKTGSSLPVACGVGEAFFLTTAQPGSNWFLCTATNIWSLQGGGGSSGGTVNNASDVRFLLTNTSSTVLTLNGTMSTGNPAVVFGGTTAFKFTTPSTLTVSGTASTGTVRVCFDPNTGQLSLYHNLAATITGTGDLSSHVFTGSSCPYAQLWAPTMTNANAWDTLAESMDTRGSLFFPVPYAAGNAISITGGVIAVTGLPTVCNISLGDGANSLAAATYVKAGCANEYGSNFAITAIKCRTDNAGGHTTLTVTNGAGTALLTSAITCGSTGDGVAGTQSSTMIISAGDLIKFTVAADGTSKDVMVTVAGSR
jgi:hypothetical protein